MDETMFHTHSQQDQVPAHLTSTPLYQIPQYTQVATAPPMPFPQPGLSETDIIRIASVVKQMLTSEIDMLVKERVERETADMRNAISSLQADNKKLSDSVSRLEVKLSTRVDDLKQYSRRSCLRIAGITESEDEDTDMLVLRLADRLNINVQSDDIEESHRVGPQRRRSGADAGDFGMVDDPQPSKPRQIIVKFRNPKARLALLKGRAALRKKKEKTL